MPDFPSPSIFAALLDRERGGTFAFTPRGFVAAQQRYVQRTNVLLTRIECTGGVVEITDFMTMPEAPHDPQEIVRIAQCVAGSVEFDVMFDPRPDYAQMEPQLRGGDATWSFAAPGVQCDLRTSFAMRGRGSEQTKHVAMRQGETQAAVLT